MLLLCRRIFSVPNRKIPTIRAKVGTDEKIIYFTSHHVHIRSESLSKQLNYDTLVMHTAASCALYTQFQNSICTLSYRTIIHKSLRYISSPLFKLMMSTHYLVNVLSLSAHYSIHILMFIYDTSYSHCHIFIMYFSRVRKIFMMFLFLMKQSPVVL